MKKLIIIGGMGNGSVVASAVDDINDENQKNGRDPAWEMLGFLNDGDPVGTVINGYPVLGVPEDITETRFQDVEIFFALISLRYGDNNAKRLENMGLSKDRFATIIHPTAIISKHAMIGKGVAIMPLVHIGPNCEIGNHVSLFGNCFVGHNSKLADYTYVANNACIGADVKLEKGSYLGTNATTLEGVTLGGWCIVGIGSVVIRDIPPMTIAAGNPAKVIRERAFETFKK
jgi:acetyltransferase EpsM